MALTNYRLRFAPSPTGGLHLGGVRTALYAYLFAKKHNGTFVLRIEDTDESRRVNGAEEYIIKALEWCGIYVDEGPHMGGDFAPYRQSDRTALYKEYAEQLVNQGNAYYAFDTKEEVEILKQRQKDGFNTYNFHTRLQMCNSLSLTASETKKLRATTPYVIRFKNEPKRNVIVRDALRGDVTFDTSIIDDKVLLKSTGLPTYHLAVVVDDYLMKISHVFRGEEWLPSAPVHVLLWKYLGWETVEPTWVHLPLILNPGGKGKLSKRQLGKMNIPIFPIAWKPDRASDTQLGYKEEGFLPEGFLNMLALLGWKPDSQQEIFTMSELIDQYSIAKTQQSSATFDYEKARWINHRHIQGGQDSLLVACLCRQLEERGIAVSEELVECVVPLIKERCYTLNELWDNSFFFFQRPTFYDWQSMQKPWDKLLASFFKTLCKEWQEAHFATPSTLEAMVKSSASKFKEMKFGSILMVCRLMVVGKKAGPSIFSILHMIGIDEARTRLSYCMQELRERTGV